MKEVLHCKRHRSRQPEMLERLKTSNASVKAALAKTSMAEQQESSKNYKLAFGLYKEAVELLMPVAEGMMKRQTYYVLHTMMDLCIAAELVSPVEKRVIKSQVRIQILHITEEKEGGPLGTFKTCSMPLQIVVRSAIGMVHMYFKSLIEIWAPNLQCKRL